MKYRDWCIIVEGLVNNMLPKGFHAELQEIRKNNNISRLGLVIRGNAMDIEAAPIIYLDNYYRDNEENVRKAAGEITNDFCRMENDIPQLIYQKITWETVRDKIYISLVNTERNQDMLATIPSEQMGNLSLVPRVLVSRENSGIASFIVKNEMFEQFGISRDEMFAQAKINTPVLFPPVIRPLKNYLNDFLNMDTQTEEDSLFPMLIITNENGIDGAAAVLYPEMGEKISSCIGGSFVLLPSSVHEMMAVPAEGVALQELKELVMEVNQIAVSPTEFLADDIYFLKDGGLTSLDAKITEEVNNYLRENPGQGQTENIDDMYPEM